MAKIISKKKLNNQVTLMEIYAPLIASSALPGQFVIIMPFENSERIPLTISNTNKDTGTIEIIFQIVGKTTLKLNTLNEGDDIANVVGPLGKPTNLENINKAIVIGGGVGSAIALPIATKLHNDNKKVDSIIGFRNKDLVILEDRFNDVSDNLYITTDDGSYKIHGNVTMPLEKLLQDGKYDAIFAIGPVIMMKFVTLTAKKYNVPVIVSLNSIMIDGTGMCGGCRVKIKDQDGNIKTKFACVDGPDFDGYSVDFDSLSHRNSFYKEFEKHEYEKECNLLKEEA